MNAKQVIIGGLAFGAIALVVQFAVGYAFNAAGQTSMNDYMLPVFKSPTAPEFNLMWALPFLAGIFVAKIYGFARSNVPGEGVKKGLCFGLVAWLLGGLNGMLWTWTSFAVPTMLVVSWTVSGLVGYLVGGIVLELIFGKFSA